MNSFQDLLLMKVDYDCKRRKNISSPLKNERVGCLKAELETVFRYVLREQYVLKPQAANVDHDEHAILSWKKIDYK